VTHEGRTADRAAEQAEILLPSPRRRRPLAAGLATASSLVLAGGILFAAGVFEGDGAPATADPAATPAPTASPTPEEIPGETIGTPENPFRPGDSFTFFDDWTFTFGQTNTDAWPALASYYEETFPDELDDHEPGPGMVYLTAPVTMTYTGAPADQDNIMIALHHVSTDGTETGNSSCGLLRRNFTRFVALDVRTKPVVEGSLCAEIPTENIPGGQWWIYLSYWDSATGTELDQQYYYTAE
jgi:hypothetical protein